VHMTPELLNPADDVLDAFILAAAQPGGRRLYGRVDALQSWRLDNVTCPETGYRYGRSWLAESIPDHALAVLARLVETGDV